MPPKVLTQANMDLLWACLETLPTPDWDVVAGEMGITHGAAYTRFYRLRAYYAGRKKEGKDFVDDPPALTPTGTNAAKKLAQDAEAGENTELDENFEADESEDDVV